MNKVKINLDILLPGVPDEKDACVNRLLSELSARKGIEKTHIVTDDKGKTQLCLHYDPQVVSVEKVQKMARQAGGQITDRYRHLLLEVEGIRHQRQTRLIEAALGGEKGVLSVSASAGGMVLIEYDGREVNQDKLYTLLKKQGLQVRNKKESAGNGHAQGDQRIVF